MSYEGIVCELSVRPHPNADKLALATANGFQVIVSKDTEDKAIGVFFMADTQLSHELCMEAGLYRKHPETQEPLGGYLEANRRVTSMKLRGEISEGLWLPLERLDFLKESFSLGDLVGVVNGHTVAQKYIPQHVRTRMERNAQGKKGKKAVEVEFPTFLKHYDTSQLRMNLGKVTPGALCIVTEKLHGTSARSGYLKRETELQPPWWKFWAKPRKVVSYDRVYGSRNVAYFNDKAPVSANPDEHGQSLKLNYRWICDQDLDLHKGETVYYEIVGYEGNERPIMGRHSLGKTDPVHKEIRQQYGVDSVVYDYGCKPGEWEMYVYRITMTNEDGVVTELSWDQVRGRCATLGVKHVPEIYRFIYGEGIVDREQLLVNCAAWARGKSLLGDHLREGLCLRVESHVLNEAFKYKGFEFCHLEGIAKNDEGYIDTEDIS